MTRKKEHALRTFSHYFTRRSSLKTKSSVFPFEEKSIPTFLFWTLNRSTIFKSSFALYSRIKIIHNRIVDYAKNNFLINRQRNRDRHKWKSSIIKSIVINQSDSYPLPMNEIRGSINWIDNPSWIIGEWCLRSCCSRFFSNILMSWKFLLEFVD